MKSIKDGILMQIDFPPKQQKVKARFPPSSPKDHKHYCP